MVDQRPSFVCPKCRRTSWHPDDVKNGYCGHCHEFVSVDGFVTVPTVPELAVMGLARPLEDGAWWVSSEGARLLGAGLRENGRRAALLEAERPPVRSREDLPPTGGIEP